MKKESIKGKIILLIASILWGFAFVAQNKVANLVDTFTLNGIRCLLSALFLFPFVLIRKKKKTSELKPKKNLWISGIICGIFLCIAMNLQQFGISTYPDGIASSGRSGFITALYVVFVPLMSLFFKKKLHINNLISSILATLGMYLLCFNSKIDSIYIGDLIVMGCALAFSFQILFVDKYSNVVDGFQLSFLQFLTCGILSSILMFIFEKPNLKNILSASLPILYLAIVSNGIGYTLQIIGQKYSKSPTIDSIIMSLESVFAAIGGAIFLKEQLTNRELIGCFILFLAVIIAQIPFHRLSKKAKTKV